MAALVLAGLGLSVGLIGTTMVVIGLVALVQGQAIAIALLIVGLPQTAFVGFFGWRFFNGRRWLQRFSQEGVVTTAEVAEHRLDPKGRRVLETGTYRFKDLSGTIRTGRFAHHVHPEDRTNDLAPGAPLEIAFLPDTPAMSRPSRLIFTD